MQARARHPRSPRAERAATDPDARPLGGREADGAAGHGAAARPVPGRGGGADAARARSRPSSAAGVPVTLIGKPLKVDPLALARLVRFLKAKRFDVVQTWIFAANTYGRVRRAWRGVPVVVTAEMAVDLWKGARTPGDRPPAGPAGATSVVGNSHAVVDFYRQAGRARRPAGDDLLGDRRRGAAAGRPRRRPRRVRLAGRRAVGPLRRPAGRRRKRVGDLLEALDLLQHVRPELRTLIVGDGPLATRARRDRPRLSARRQASGSSATATTCRGCWRRPTCWSCRASYEGLPNMVLEAMRFRKPVVATAAPARPRSSSTARPACLVPCTTPSALAQAIRTVVDDPALARPHGRGGPRPRRGRVLRSGHGRAVRRALRGAVRAKGLRVERRESRPMSITWSVGWGWRSVTQRMPLPIAGFRFANPAYKTERS